MRLAKLITLAYSVKTRPQPVKCSCGKSTKHGKPWCSKHIARMPYVKKIRRTSAYKASVASR